MNVNTTFKYLFFPALFFLSQALSAQAPDTLWTKTFGGNNYDGGFSVQQTSDGGYFICGVTYSSSETGFDFFLIKTDPYGDTLWTKTYGGSNTDWAYSAQQTTDGGYIIAGDTYSFGKGLSDVWLIKTDANGDTLWSKTFGGSDYDASRSVKQTTDGGYIIAGSASSFSAGNYDVWLIKTDVNGDTLWTKTIGTGGREIGNSIQETSDGGYIITGEYDPFGYGIGDVWLIKTDASGDTLWTRSFGGYDGDGGNSVQQTFDGGYIIAGFADFSSQDLVSDVWLIKADANGDTLWTKKYGGSGHDWSNSVCQSSDGGYIMVGGTESFGAGSNDVWLIKSNSNGDTLWTKTLGGSSNDYGLSVKQTLNAGCVITAITESLGAGGSDVWLIRVAPETESGVDFACSLDVDDNNGSSLASPLVFGTSSDATDDYDASYDQYAPPPPPSGGLDGRFRINSEDLLKDLRATNTGTIEWHLIYQPSAGGDPMTLSWDPSELAPEGRFRLLDYFSDGTLVNIDMRTQSSYTDNLNLHQLKIVYSLTSTFDMIMTEGWNMIGLPLEVDDGYYLTLFPNAIPNTLYGYSESYVLSDTLKLCKGYWLRFPASEMVTIEGYPVASSDIDLAAGWNMITGISCNVALNDVNDPGRIIIPGTLYGFDNSYVLSDTIKQGRGYWIRTNADGTVTLDCGGAGSAELSLTPLNTLIESTQMSAIELTDVMGASQTLYFNVKLDDPSRKLGYSLPPVPPVGSFDARFVDDYRLTETDEGVIQLQSSYYPVTVQFSNLPTEGEYRLEQLVGEEVIESGVLAEEGSIEVSNPQVKQLSLGKVEALELPTEFTVQQNYPNPFNPTTEIHYGLPERAKVEIVVYNVLGQKIRELVSDEKEAGYHRGLWDGKNDIGEEVGSGIYIYRIIAGRYNAAKKMVLLK